MEFKKITIEDSSVSDILTGCSKCNCGCNVCNSQDNPKESSDNDGKELSSSRYSSSNAS